MDSDRCCRKGEGGRYVLLEEEVLVVCVRLRVLLEALVGHQNVVGRKHHKRASLLILELLRAVPLSPDPPLQM